GDRFCERCGARLGEAAPAGIGCHACGAPVEAIDGDGYCSICGVRARDASDRIELDLVIAAAVSDQGLHHRRNEDAFELAVVPDQGVAVVVCDGISTASSSDVAAGTAAKVAAEVLMDAIGAGSDGRQAMVAAVGAAQEAVGQVPWTTRADRALPSCTLVSALWRSDEVIVAWVGDSRAYWLAREDSRQLTVDDSWAEEEVAEGRLTAEEAARDARLHSITHWVGADAPDRPPRLVTLRPDRPGLLIVCTDGLWNYAPSAAELSALIDELPAGAAPAAVARSLTDTALARGGHDNITVAVVDIDPA
ncbi:MAG: family protein phosphatase, partial [Solirubrobacteraceae bacterium]|nr:family protein phosphatase [Solirubrobacteraceae bacterium]